MSPLRGHGLGGRASLSVQAGSDLALGADGRRGARDEQDRERACVATARLDTPPIADGRVGETVDRGEELLTSTHVSKRTRRLRRTEVAA